MIQTTTTTRALATIPRRPLRDELHRLAAHAAAPVLRPIGRWVEEEIVLPNGPFAGARYRHDRHPVSRPWFAALESGRWSRYAATGPTQNGKTLMVYVLPVLYHLFEIGETVIIGLPSMDMAGDKWEADFLPAIAASRYHELLPTRGEGSRGGQVKRAIHFRNGATLRFMSGGGDDKKRAGYTARVLAVTETDGLDEAGATSREANKIEQLEGRTRAYGHTGKRIYLECTVSIERGRIWQEVTAGTDSRLARPCPHCGAYVTPEREHLVGWQQAESEEQARALAHWSCPQCAAPWSEEERRAAAARAVLVHRGQSVDARGAVVGPDPETQTFGLRWSAIDNPFALAADLGAEEWTARRQLDRDNAEKKMRQFVWCLPYLPPTVTMTPLEAEDVARRGVAARRRGVAPAGAVAAVVGVDTGKRRLHWVAQAVAEDGTAAIVDYGVQPVDADRLGTRRALVAALKTLARHLARGWPLADGTALPLAQCWIDSAYHEHTDGVYDACAELNRGLPAGGERFRPMKGYGEGQQRMQIYRAPAARSEAIAYIGRQLHISRVRRGGRLLPGVLLVHVNADTWKSELHQRLAMPADAPGAITLWDAPDPYEHADFAAQVTAEQQVEKQLPSGRTAIVWQSLRRENHFLDAAYVATAAGQFALEQRAIADSAERPATLAELAAAARREKRS